MFLNINIFFKLTSKHMVELHLAVLAQVKMMKVGFDTLIKHGF